MAPSPSLFFSLFPIYSSKAPSSQVSHFPLRVDFNQILSASAPLKSTPSVSPQIQEVGSGGGGNSLRGEGWVYSLGARSLEGSWNLVT